MGHGLVGRIPALRPSMGSLSLFGNELEGGLPSLLLTPNSTLLAHRTEKNTLRTNTIQDTAKRRKPLKYKPNHA
eukprot:5706918-Amphidinium_carterae.1